MSIIDIVIVIVFVGAIIYGLYKGIISQLGSLGGIILGVIACRIFGDMVAGFIGNTFPAMSDNPDTAAFACSVIANVLVFLVAYLLVKLLAKVIKSLTDALSLGFIDRILGAVFGLFKWCLILSIILNLWLVISPKTSFVAASSIADGMAVKAILDLAPTLFGSIIPA